MTHMLISARKACLTFSGAEKIVLHFLVEHRSYMISRAILFLRMHFLHQSLAYSRPKKTFSTSKSCIIKDDLVWCH